MEARMRVNTRVVCDIETGKVLARDSFEYAGPVARCDPSTATAILIASIIGAATTATTTGLGLANQPGAPKPTPLQSTAPTSVTQADKQLVSQQLPTLQSQLGGDVSPNYFSQLSQQNAGILGQQGAGGGAQQAIAQFFGGGGGGNQSPGLTGGSGLTGKSSSSLVDNYLQQLQERITGGTG